MSAQAPPPTHQIKAVILDSTKANIIIKQLVAGDVAKAKVKILENRVILRDTMIKRLRKQSSTKDEKIVLMDLNLVRKDSIVSLRESEVKKEKRKKNFWKYAFYGALGYIGYSLAK